MALFADPVGLDRPAKLLDRRGGRQIGGVVFALQPCRPVFADQPNLLAGLDV